MVPRILGPYRVSRGSLKSKREEEGVPNLVSQNPKITAARN
jgi:hypothetical protein